MTRRPCLEPITINGLEVKNRIVRQAHGTEYGHGSIVDGYRRLSDAIRPSGMRMFTQLWHGGCVWPNSDGTPSWAPSAVPSPWGAVPIAMTLEQIESVAAGFEQSAVWSR